MWASRYVADGFVFAFYARLLTRMESTYKQHQDLFVVQNFRFGPTDTFHCLYSTFFFGGGGPPLPHFDNTLTVTLARKEFLTWEK